MSSIIGSQRREAKATPRGRSLRRRVAAPASAALVGLWASVASAEVLLFSANPSTVTFMAPTILDLNGPATGGAQLTFATTQANQRVIITFNAFCAVISPPDGNGGGPGDVLIEVLVDPAGSVGEFSAPPTAGGGRRFCRGTNADTNDVNGSSATVVASARPDVAGTHKLRVRASIPQAGLRPPWGAIAQLSLTVMR